MPRNATPRVDPGTLPEFLRSRAIGAVIAEALDASTDDELSHPGAVTTMINDAAREIREFHGLPGPSARPTPPTPQAENTGWHRGDPAEDSEASA